MGFNLGEIFKKDEETLVIDRRKQAIKALIIFTVIIAIVLTILIVLKNVGDVDETRRIAITKDIQNIQLYVKDKASQARTESEFAYPGLDLNRSGDESAYRMKINGFEEEYRYGYYYLTPSDYDDMSMALNIENEHYIVNYNTADVINVRGIKYGNGVYHSVDDLVAISSIVAGNKNVTIPSANTILLKTPADMNRLHEYPNANFKMTSNIDMSSYSAGQGWKPVKNFTGNFDGRGYTISNLKISRPTESYVGLFGDVADGTIRNLRLSNVNVAGENYTGALAGTMYGQVSNVIIDGGNVSGADRVGGLVGAHQGNISQSKVNLSIVSGQEEVGGVVGAFNSGTIERVKANVVNINADSAVGGFAGLVSAASEAYLQECVAVIQKPEDDREEILGGISANEDVGGMIGRVEILNQYALNMKNCYAIGNINEGKANKGGIIGKLKVSANGAIDLTAIYAAVSILDKNETSGGCIGLSDSSATARLSANYVFWEKNLAPGEILENVGKTTSNKINFTSKTPTEMMVRSTFTNWDFDVWDIKNYKSRPFLKFESSFMEY